MTTTFQDGMPANIQLEKARLIPYQGDNLVEDDEIVVQFNPASLRVTLTNSLKTPGGGQGRNATAAQFIDKSSSRLQVQLIFDSTADSTDVRQKTKPIAMKFMNPEESGGDEPRAPRRCRFQWGAFAFDGLMKSYSETLDFFAPEGIPLRATLSLTLAEDRFQFEDREVEAVRRDTPIFGAGDGETPVSTVQQQSGGDPSDWRRTAMYNGIESPRRTLPGDVAIPRNPDAPGHSDRLGGRIPGAFGE